MKIVVYIVAGAGMCITDAALFTFLTVSVGTKGGSFCGRTSSGFFPSPWRNGCSRQIVTGKIYVYSEDGAGREIFLS